MRTWGLLVVSLVAGGAAVDAGCARDQTNPSADGKIDNPPSFDPDSGSFVGNLGNGSAGAACDLPARSCTTCEDFPAQPIVDDTPEVGSPATPSDAPTHFTGTPATTGGPCIVEPADGTLIPRNWLRPRFQWNPLSSSQTLYQVRLHAQRQQNDFVAYTASKSYALPKAIWDKLRATTYDEAITLTISAVDPTRTDPPVSSTSTFTIAPAGADGSMIYWAAIGEFNGQSWLEGFRAGDEGSVSVVTAGQVKFNQSRDQGGQVKQPQAGPPGSVECIGCHTAVPDGNSVTFLDFWPWDGVVSSVEDKHAGELPSWLTPGGAQAFNMPWLGITTFSKAEWTNHHVAVTTYGCDPSSAPWNGQTCSDAPGAALAWIDLSSPAPVIAATNSSDLGKAMLKNQGTSYGFLARNGDSRGAAAPSWSHDGSTIVYVSTNAEKDGRLAKGVADLWTVPYAARAGGAASPVGGASDPSFSEYYPAYSPDDQLIAFTRAPASEEMYYNRHAEIFVVPGAGGTATRLSANDGASCSGVTSPGVTNSWPKWAPNACTVGTKTYYWIVFSSSRSGAFFDSSKLKNGGTVPTSQLYLAGVVKDGATLTTSPAVYLWNQGKKFNGANQSNHTPVWEVVAIPPVQVPR